MKQVRCNLRFSLIIEWTKAIVDMIYLDRCLIIDISTKYLAVWCKIPDFP